MYIHCLACNKMNYVLPKATEIRLNCLACGCLLLIMPLEAPGGFQVVEVRKVGDIVTPAPAYDGSYD